MKLESLTTKKTVTVATLRKGAELKYQDLLTFCYRADQHRFGTIPSVRRVAKATGLKESTVSDSTARLAEWGFINGEGAVTTVCPHPDWFCGSEALQKRFSDQHYFSWLTNWKCLVRRPGADNPLTVPAVMVYSLIRHSVSNGWKPSGGWTYDYLSIVTGTNPKTVTKAIGALVGLGFISVLDGMRFRFYQLRPGQLDCFSDRGEWSGSSSEPDEILQEFGPGSDLLDQRRSARAELAKYMERWPIPVIAKEEVINTVMRRDGWETRWQEWACELVDKYLDSFCPA